AREHLPLGEHRARERARDALSPHGPERLGGGRRGRDEALRVHALLAGAGPGWALPSDRPLLPVVEGARVRLPGRIHRARGQGQPEHAIPLRRARRPGAERRPEAGERELGRDPRRRLQGRSRRSARVAGPQGDGASRGPGRPDRLPRSVRPQPGRARIRPRVPGAHRRAPGRSRHRRGGDRPSGRRPRPRGRAGAARDRLPKRRRGGQRAGREAVSEPVRVGMVGLGRWGRHLLRNFATLPESDLRWCCDPDPDVLAQQAAAYPAARPTASFDDLLEDSALEAVVLATPVPTHHALARQALEAGKHVFVEKPMTFSASEARDLRDVVQRTGGTLMVGHLLRYHPAVVKLRELIDAGELGDVRYVYGNRVNLGTIRPDENALWSLGVHDVSVVLHLLGDDPDEVSARGECYVRPNVQDVVFGYMHFATGQIGHLHLSWLDPDKMRKMTVVGTRKMA